MPAVSSGSRILVTGASGYIASWIIKALLERGFTVRGTVRSESKGAVVKETFKKYGNNVEFVLVEDIAKEEGAFDEAVKDVDAIIHTASPFTMKVDDPDDLIVPAVKGTTGLLASAQRATGNTSAGPARLRRIVLLSSCAAIMGPGTTPRTADESVWNDEAVANVRSRGRAASPMEKYRASKSLAERAAWEFYETWKHRAELSWDLVVLNPPLVLGPFLYPTARPEDLSESLLQFWGFVTGTSGMSPEVLARAGTSWVDVRDVAEAHVLALLKPEAGGERIILSVGPFKFLDLVLAARRAEGDNAPSEDEVYESSKAVHLVRYIRGKEQRVLGLSLKHTDLDRTTWDLLDQFKANGWLPRDPL
ncbi:NAD(P)-binding protein [Trametes polyzona]|nr:NAD(P)-binding protein [Trametes polyzona]